jgi:hypothetical protein
MSDDFDKGDETDEVVFTSDGDDNNNDDMKVFAFGGQSSTHLFRRSDAPHPPEWIKNCVGTVTVTKPNGVDAINYIIIVDDGFELRDIEECIPATSDKEYTKKLVLKKVH